MLTVYSILWGDKYTVDYAQRLRLMVARNLCQPHRFVCITDQRVDGVECQKPVCDYHGWWQKVSLFKPSFANGLCMFLDLDVVVIDELDLLVKAYHRDKIAMARNWNLSGYRGWQSSFMLWNGEQCHEIWERFDYEKDSKRLWGDQEFITELLGEDVTEIEPGRIVSYKYHCQMGPPPGARVVAFHGKPDPHEVADQWVRESRSMQT